jgi:hypothetical protein
MGRRRAGACLLLIAAATAVGCGTDEPEKIDGRYRADLGAAALKRGLPGSDAPPGRWMMRIDTKLDFIEIGAPDGGGFSLAIRSLAGDRVTIEARDCQAADGSPAGDAIYDIRRSDGRLRFTKVRDRCSDRNSETALLAGGSWTRDRKAAPGGTPGY